PAARPWFWGSPPPFQSSPTLPVPRSTAAGLELRFPTTRSSTADRSSLSTACPRAVGVQSQLAAATRSPLGHLPPCHLISLADLLRRQAAASSTNALSPPPPQAPPPANQVPSATERRRYDITIV
uniref:Uncharacterized protein n=1 Tax=Oryza meridionalis TaxID=40149 RepID=A0A0E0D5J8_9ORYZ